jgi:hypothetical protein
MSELSIEKERSEDHRRRLGNAVKMVVDRRGVKKHPNEIENSEWREKVLLVRTSGGVDRIRDEDIGLQVGSVCGLIVDASVAFPAYPINRSVQPEHRLAPRLSSMTC